MVHTPSSNRTALSTMELIKSKNQINTNNNNNNNNNNNHDITNVAEQFANLREAIKHFTGIEKPLKYGPTIETLSDLIAALHKEFATDRVDIEMVNHIMLAYKSKWSEWKRFAKFDRYKYTRNLVDAGNGKFNLLVLCWGEGHASAIHDHADSHCFMKMLKGSLRETRYEMPSVKTEANDHADIGNGGGSGGGGEENTALTPIGQSSIETNDVAYINDNLGLHRIENPSHTDQAVSLHLYCPPFDACSVFHGSHRVKCPVTFYSVYGDRLNKQKSNA